MTCFTLLFDTRNKGKICGTNVSEGVSPATGFIVGWGLGGVGWGVGGVDMTSVLSSEGYLAAAAPRASGLTMKRRGTCCTREVPHPLSR